MDASPFLSMTYDTVDDPTTNEVVSWSNSNNSFVIWDPKKFAADILPNYFRHNNFSSFLRQLHIYACAMEDVGGKNVVTDCRIRSRRQQQQELNDIDLQLVKQRLNVLEQRVQLLENQNQQQEYSNDDVDLDQLVKQRLNVLEQRVHLLEDQNRIRELYGLFFGNNNNKKRRLFFDVPDSGSSSNGI